VPLGMLILWMIRVRLTGWYKHESALWEHPQERNRMKSHRPARGS
jgi:hypothetical protein